MEKLSPNLAQLFLCNKYTVFPIGWTVALQSVNKNFSRELQFCSYAKCIRLSSLRNLYYLQKFYYLLTFWKQYDKSLQFRLIRLLIRNKFSVDFVPSAEVFIISKHFRNSLIKACNLDQHVLVIRAYTDPMFIVMNVNVRMLIYCMSFFSIQCIRCWEWIFSAGRLGETDAGQDCYHHCSSSLHHPIGQSDRCSRSRSSCRAWTISRIVENRKWNI